MKVLHVITRMNTGGPAVFLDHLTNSMKDLGVESIIAYGYCESNESDYTDTHSLKAKLVKVKSLHRSIAIIDDIRTFIQVRKIIKKYNPDLVNTHTSKAGVLGRLAAKSIDKKFPVVHTFHGHLIYGYFAPIKSFLFTTVEKFMARYTSAAVAVTNETKASLQHLGIGKKLNWNVIQIGIPIIHEVNNSLSSNAGLRLLWVGRFTDIKDPLYAINVMKYLSNDPKNNFQLSMAGDGELLNEVKKLAYELPINFLGWVSSPFTVITNFDLLLITSKNEGLPLVMLEAAGKYRSTISRNVGGVGEFIENEVTGYLVDGDAELMAQKLISIETNKSDLNQTGINARTLLEKQFSTHKMSKNYFTMYSKLII